MNSNGFKIGDKVEWASQAAGTWKTKSGVIAEIVGIGSKPSREMWPQLHKGWGCGFPRKHISYVVLVGKRPYWPLANKLKLAETQPAAENA